MNKNTKTLRYKSSKINYSFSGTRLTQYAGSSPIMDYINKLQIGEGLNRLFPTVKHNSTKYSNAQILLSILLSSIAGINRLKRTTNFTKDLLISSLLNLRKGLNKEVISTRIKLMGAEGSYQLDSYIGGMTKEFIKKTKLETIALDCDSTVKQSVGIKREPPKVITQLNPGRK